MPPAHLTASGPPRRRRRQGGTGAEPSAQELDELATTIEAEDVPAIFGDVSSPQALAESLAAEVGDVEVVTLFSESLGGEGSGGATYEER